MGACATKPKVKADDLAAIPAPEPIDHDIVKNTEEVKVVEEEKKIDQTDEEKKEDNEKFVVEEEKPPSLASLLVEKEATPEVEVPSVPKAEEKSKAEEVAAPTSEAEVKKSEEKPKEKDEKSL